MLHPDRITRSRIMVSVEFSLNHDLSHGVQRQKDPQDTLIVVVMDHH